MRPISKLIIAFSFVSLASASISCQKQPDHELAKGQENATSQQSNNGIDSKPKIEVVGNTLVKGDGWQLPPLSAFLEKSTSVFDRRGSGKIMQTDYVPADEVVQIADGNTVTSTPRDPDIEDKSWEIRYLKVFSTDGKPFCYLMRGYLVSLNQSGRIEHRVTTAIVLVYYDQDGDGIFETFKYSSSESPPIPRWLDERP